MAGVLGNIKNEGKVGQFENSNYEKKPNEKPNYLTYVDEKYSYRGYSNKNIMNIGIKKTLELQNKCLSTYDAAKGDYAGKFGLGMVQLTGDRTSTLLTYYMKYATKDCPTYEECLNAEIACMSDELLGDYYSVYKDWKKGNQSVELAATKILTDYEKPKTMDTLSARIEDAKNIYEIMNQK